MPPVDIARDHVDHLIDVTDRSDRREALEAIIFALCTTAPEQVTAAIRYYLGMDESPTAE